MTRLIDGELSDVERSDFLVSLDEEGSGDWRVLALGLLERQLITDALRQLEGQSHKKVILPSQGKSKAPRFGDWLMRAALLMLGLMLGFASPRLIDEKNLKIAGEGPFEVTPNDERLEAEVAPGRLADSEGHAPIRGGYVTANFEDGSQIIVPISHVASRIK